MLTFLGQVVHPPPGWQVSACCPFQRPALMVGTAAVTTTTTTVTLSPSTLSTAGSGPPTGSQPEHLGTDVSSSSSSSNTSSSSSGSNNSGRGHLGHVNRRALDVHDVVGAAHCGSPRFNAEPAVPAGYGCWCAPVIRTGTVCAGMGAVSGNRTRGIPVQGLMCMSAFWLIFCAHITAVCRYLDSSSEFFEYERIWDFEKIWMDMGVSPEVLHGLG
jgi:hypothetical protein